MTTSFLNKKIEKILNSTLEDDQETLDAIKALSSFFNENTISSRRNLRSTFEKRSLQINKEFLASFNEVNKLIDNLYRTADQMNQNCLKVKRRFEEVKIQNQNLINISNDIQNKVDLINHKQILLNRFIEKFQLSDSEQAILNSNQTDLQTIVNDNFFKLFDKIRKIHGDAKILFESNYQTTGIEIMDNMSNNLEILYDKLYKWTVNALRTYNSDNLSVDSHYIYKALSLLEERPILFKLCLDEYSTIRRSIVSEKLINQLTKNNLIKDQNQSINYVSEIMNWIYETTKIERNHLVNLFKDCTNHLKDEQFNDDVKNTLKEYLSFIMESLDEPIKVRLEQILLKETNCINSFNLRNLLKYYNQQILNLLHKKSKLNTTIYEIYLVSHRIFINLLNSFCTFELATNSNYDFEEISPSLSSTPIINKTNQLLKELINNTKQNYLTKQEKQETINCILNIIFYPYVNAVNTSVSKLNYLEKHIFIINCLNEMYDVLGKCSEFTNTFREQLKNHISGECDQIVLEYCSNSLSLCDLSTLYNTINNQSEDKLNLHSSFYSIALQSCNKKVEIFLDQCDNYFLAKIMLIKKGETRSKVKRECLERFAQIYEQIYEYVHSSSSENDDPNKILNIKPKVLREKFNLE